MDLILDNLYFREQLKKMYELRQAEKMIPENLIRHTLDFGEKIGIPPDELAFLEAILEKPVLH